MARFSFLGGSSLTSLRPRARFLGLMVFLALAGFWTVVYSFSTYVRPYEVAIKMSRYGGGLEKDPYYGPALYFTGPGVTYHRFPIVVQSLNLTSSTTESTFGTEYDRSIRALEVDSLDGSKIKIDATILYRINDAYAVMTRIGPGRIFEDNAIIPKSAEALKESLGKLKAEDFYNEKLRIQATEEARVNLNNRVKEFGMAVDHVLIRQYYYLPEYQAQIEARKVQDQLVNTNQSMAEAAKTEALRGKLDAEGQALVNVESQRAASEVTKIKAEADLYSRKRRSEGDLLVSLAEARGKELENNAYRASAGSENLVGLEMAEALDGIEVIFLQSGKNGVNPIDLNQTLNLFDVKGN